MNQEIEWERPDKLKKSYIGTTKELKENRAMDKTKYRIILDNMQEGVVVLQNRTTVYSNASMERITGYKKGQIKDKDFLKIIYEDDRQLVIENYMNRLKGETISAYDIRIKPKTGDLRWFMISAIKITWDAKDAVLVYLTDINKRKQAEQALKENENWLQVLLKNVPGGIFQYRFYDDKTVKIEFMSKGAEDLFEKTREELLNPDVLYECIHPEDAESFMESIANAYSDLTPWFTETRIIVNGRIKWVRGVATSKADEDNSVIWNGVLMDITREKEATLALEHNSKLYKTLNTRMHQMLQLDTLEEIYGFITQTLHDQYPDSAVIFASVNKEQTKGRIIKNIGIPKSMIFNMLEAVGFDMLNREYNMLPEHYKEYTSGELVTFKKGFADFVGSEISHFIARAVEKIIEIPVIHGIGINNDGRLFGIVYFFSKNKNFTADKVYVESFLGQAGIVINRKLMEESLRRSEDVFRNLVENQGEGVGITDENEIFTFANPVAHEIFGVKQGELVNASLKSFLSKESQLKIMRETSLRKQGQKSVYEIEIIQPGGKVVPLLVTVTPQYDGEHNFTGSFGVFRDITENKHAEMLMRKSEEHYRMLSVSASDMLMLNEVDDIYKYITETLQKHLSDTIVLFNLVDEQRFKIKLLSVNGVNNKILKKVIRLNGENILGKEYNLLPGHHELFKQGRVIQFEGGLAGFASTEKPAFVSNAIQKLVGVKQIYSIGINQTNRLYAVVHLFTLKNEVEINHKFIESFIKQAGIVIERKLLEQELKASEEKFSSFLSRSSDAILLTDEKYNLIYLNRAFEKLVGYEKAEMCGYDVFELNYLLLPDELKKTKSFRQFKEELMKEITSVHAHTHGKLVDTEVKGKHGKICGVQARFFMIRTKEGNRLGAICRDVTDQKEKEKSLQELNATKDRLFSIIGHDLKNPLNSIVGFTQLINQNFDSYPEEKLKKFIGIIHQSASSLSALLDNLLLWSHAQRQKITVEPVAVSFRKITGKCMDLLRATADKKNIEFQNKLNEKHVGYADSQMMTTVIRNLLANAIKFTPHGGRIVVDGKIQHEKIIVSIQDSGIGIEKEVARNLFNPSAEFSTEGTDGEKGTGLGLIICKEFIEKNHGNIWVESEIGKGAAFFICVPATETVL